MQKFINENYLQILYNILFKHIWLLPNLSNLFDFLKVVFYDQLLKNIYNIKMVFLVIVKVNLLNIKKKLEFFC